ncbi:tRNA pseudouridine(38-40) synthase TruA [uncultured Adlercreutzia sp.]|uniref:tRNA pseudouridine(38-40) synthase TruA n=1 Tax=uncultured Adlercreutzia sp. TaxID=875803 RepID=UPI00272E707D|nr:tRNA pseudouridine(38-40) synthase TruA [uncultured Adlercreutzia sp.]
MPSELSRPSLAQRAGECLRERSFSCTVGYDGAPFAGFAKQPGQATVQGELEGALALLLRRPVDVVCAGRTDAGVHARGQVVSFDADTNELRGRTLHSLRRSLNALTAEGVVVRAVDERPRGFSARFDAQWREYKYYLSCGDVPPVFTGHTSWFVGPNLDIAAMERGAAHLIGEHDFKSFCMAASAVGKPTCRNVSEISIASEEILGEPHRVITVRGNAFLHSMVRTIVGTLVMVGRGMREPDWVAEVLAARDRQAAGENAPAAGLVFWSVHYGEEAAPLPA